MPPSDKVLRDQISALLEGGQAYKPPQAIVAGVTPRLRGARPDAPGMHSPWELLEHLRLSQQDILRYTFDPKWRSPSWPSGYWPQSATPAAGVWEESQRAFLADLEEAQQRLQDPDLDLTAQLPHGEGRTYVRQFLVLADHNAYHLGQLVLTRKLLKDWPEG